MPITYSKKTSNTHVDVNVGKWISGIKIGECFLESNLA